MQNEIGRLRRKFREGRAEIFPAAARTAPCRDLLHRYSELIDSLVREIFEASCIFADKEAKRSGHAGLAIIATGGYGRWELNPFSDIDIAFIPSEEADPWVEAAVHMAFKLVMDVFLSFRDIHVGYSYRPTGELPTWDIATLTALLDARHLCGDPSLPALLEKKLIEHLSPLDLVLEMRHSHVNSGQSPWAGIYSVEPDLKNGYGSLRDLHRARWLYKLLFRNNSVQLFPRLVADGFLTSERVERIEAATEWFWRARNWLHLVAGKRTDVLMNNYQDRIARELGECSAQEWLSEHYSHAETLAAFGDSAVRSTLTGPIELGGIVLRDGLLHLGQGDVMARHKAATRLFHLSQRFAIPVALKDLDALDGAAAGYGGCASDDELWAFSNILNEPGEIAATLRMLARLNLMDRFIEGFSTMLRYVPPDPAHRYTVGEHSIRIIEHLEDLRFGRDRRGHRFSELLAQCRHFDVLCLAALLHDAGKLLPGSDHSEAGLALASTVGERLRLAPEKRELLEILVRHHLLLVRTARLHDLKSATVIQSVTDKLPGAEALRHLFVFTYADSRAVADNNWTSMDYRDVEELFGKVLHALSGKARNESGPRSREERIGQIRRKLVASADSAGEEAILRHCAEMPANYVLNTPLEEIAFHLQLLRRLESEKVILDIYNRPGDDFSELTVCTYDDPQPGMLAKITGVLYGCTADIHKAQVFTMEKASPVVLDTLWIRSGGMQISENRARRIQTALKDVLTDRVPIDQFLKKAGKNPPGGIPLDSLDLRNDLSEEHTVIHVIARDLQGLLYLMTRALSRCGLHIHTAKVATWNGRAENNFYVTTLAGSQIAASDLEHWKTQLIRVFQGMDGG